ncbi:MAG: peptide ABC transporter substrate-binding protein [Clostridia bacterium]|nr:peptide ABC transporter substrate-binding protein [Clostridia bacterium]
MRQRNKRLLSLITLLVLAAFLVSACGGGGKTPATGSESEQTGSETGGIDQNQYLNLNLGEEPPSLDPGVATDVVSFEVLNATLAGLTRYDADGKLQPEIAESWDVSDDGKTYTFHLRDAKWSDGQPVTSKDFAYAWKRAIDPRTASQYAYQLYYIQGAQEANTLTPPDPKDTKKYPQGDKDPQYQKDTEAFNQQVEEALSKVGIETPDDKTLVVHLAQPTVYWLGLTSFITYLPVRQDIVEKFGDKFATDADKLVFNGPFKIDSWTHNSELVLVKNDTYWDADTVKLQKIHFDMIKDNTTIVNMFDSGQLDTTGVPSDYIQTYKDKGMLKTLADATTWYLEFNLDPRNQNKSFQNKKIRQAIALAFDRQAFVDNVLKNGSLPATALTPPSIHDQEGNSFNEKWVGKDLFPKQADVEQAKQLLQEGLQELGLKELPVVTFVGSDSDTGKLWTQAITDAITQVLGIKFKLVNVDFKTRLDMYRKSQFDMTLAGWGADYDDPETFMSLFDCPTGYTSSSPDLYKSDKVDWAFNDPHWCNDEYTNLDKSTQTTNDNTARMQAFAKMEQIIRDEIPIAPMFWPARNYVEQPWVKGIVRRATGADTEWKWAYTQGRPNS